MRRMAEKNPLASFLISISNWLLAENAGKSIKAPGLSDTIEDEI